MQRKRLTNTFVEAVKPKEKRQEIPDALLPGFYLLVQPTGRKSFAIRYRGLDGKHVKYTIGPYPLHSLADARDKARIAFDMLSRGDDPAMIRRMGKAAETVAEAYAEFLNRQARKNRSWRETDRIFRRDILPTLGHRKLMDLRKRDLIALLDPIADRAPTAANRTFAALRRFLNWCVERDLIQYSPAAGLRSQAPENKRTRTLSDDELRALWRGLELEAWPFRQWGQLLILTAQRKTEVAEAGWSEFDQAEGLWTISANRAKNGVEHVVPLGPMARHIVASLPRVDESALLFPSTFKRKEDDAERSFSGFSKLKARLHEHMKLELNVDELPRWTFHDVRRTAVTMMAREGVLPHVAEKLLNHTSGTFGGIVGVYQRFEYRNEKADALLRWEAALDRILSGPADIIALPTLAHRSRMSGRV